MHVLKRYAINVLLALDQTLNALLAGDPDETLSARMGKAIAAGRCVACRPLCWLLHVIDRDHCANAAQRDTSEGRFEAVRVDWAILVLYVAAVLVLATLAFGWAER